MRIGARINGTHLKRAAKGKRKSDPGWPCLVAAWHRFDTGLLPQAHGRSERMFETFQGRLPQELRSQEIKDIDEANRFLKEVYIPEHHARFVKAPESDLSAFVPFASNVRDILCIQEDRVISNNNTCATTASLSRLRRTSTAITSSK